MERNAASKHVNLHSDLRNSLKAVPRNGGARLSPGGGEREEGIRDLEGRLTPVTEEIASLDKMKINPADLQAALAAFDPIWSHLEPAEQARVMQLLVEKIDYDGGTGNLAIAFRPGGVRTLAAETQAGSTVGP